MYHLWFLFSFWKLLIFLNKGSYLNGKYLFQMIAFKRTSSLPCFGLLNYFLCFIAGFFSSASGNLGNRGGGCRCWKALGVNFGHRCNWSGYWMPKGMEDFYADFKAIISYLAMCLWSLCLPVGCEERLKLLCFSQPHQPALDSAGLQAWLEGLQTGVWFLPQEIPCPKLLGCHCDFHLEILNHRGVFSPPRAQKSFPLLQVLVWPQDSWFPVVWGEWGSLPAPTARQRAAGAAWPGSHSWGAQCQGESGHSDLQSLVLSTVSSPTNCNIQRNADTNENSWWWLGQKRIFSH